MTPTSHTDLQLLSSLADGLESIVGPRVGAFVWVNEQGEAPVAFLDLRCPGRRLQANNLIGISCAALRPFQQPTQSTWQWSSGAQEDQESILAACSMQATAAHGHCMQSMLQKRRGMLEQHNKPALASAKLSVLTGHKTGLF